MARLQILELPEGTGDDRPPFVLVIDQAPRDEPLFRSFRDDMELNDAISTRVGARAVLVFEDTIEIPANEVAEVFRTEVRESIADMYETARRSLAAGGEPITQVDGDRSARVSTAEAKLKAFADEHYRLDAERMGAITDALGFDRLQDWREIVSAIEEQRRAAAEGGHVFGEPGYQDPQRCARCGIDRQSWHFGRDIRPCSTVRVDAESGHDFRPIDARDELGCLRCGMARGVWVVRRDAPTCDAERTVTGVN